MKKAIIVLCFLLFLCGCEKNEPEYLVCAMGFDYANGKYMVCFETVVMNSENTKQELKLFEAVASSPQKAAEKINKQCTQPLLLSHCGVIAVSDDMPFEQFLKVCDFCYGKEEITLSAFFVKSNSPKALLSVKPLSSVSVGYDIMGLLKQNKHYKNRFFEVIKSDYKTALPLVNQKNGGLYFE